MLRIRQTPWSLKEDISDLGLSLDLWLCWNEPKPRIDLLIECNWINLQKFSPVAFHCHWTTSHTQCNFHGSEYFVSENRWKILHMFDISVKCCGTCWLLHYCLSHKTNKFTHEPASSRLAWKQRQSNFADKLVPSLFSSPFRVSSCSSVPGSWWWRQQSKSPAQQR